MGEAGRYRALLIGNSTFPLDSENLQPLEGPVNDIALLRDALTDPVVGLFDPGEVRLVPERTMAEVLVELETFFHSADRHDRLLLYYSGHGRLSEANQLFLCARDTRTDLLRSTAVSSAAITMILEASPATTTVIILDCCHSGAFKGGDLPASLRGSGRFLLTSCRGSQLANDADRRNGTSMFTQHLVEGLTGAPDRDGDGFVSLGEIYDYVNGRLAAKGRQLPQRSFAGGGDVAIARRPADVPEAGPPARAPGPAPGVRVAAAAGPSAGVPAASPGVEVPVDAGRAAPSGLAGVPIAADAGASPPSSPPRREGDGRRRVATRLVRLPALLRWGAPVLVAAVVIAVLAWPSGSGLTPGPARLADPGGLAVAADGTVFVGDLSREEVWRVTPTGEATVVAGGGAEEPDGVAATTADIDGPWALAVAGDGSLYVAGGSGAILRVDPGGVVRRLDVRPADVTLAVEALALAGDGTLYLATEARVLARAPDGVLTTVAGADGVPGYRGDGGPAVDARVRDPRGLALDGAGNLYLADTGNNRVRRISPDGVIATVAGDGSFEASPDGTAAIESGLASPAGVAVAPDGGLLVSEAGASRVRRVGPDGQITTVIGGADGGSVPDVVDGVPAMRSGLATPHHLATDGAGNLFVVDTDHRRVRRIAGGSPDGLVSTAA